MVNETANLVDQVICKRRTVKVLSDLPTDNNLNRSLVESLLTAAGWAPFHRPAAKVRTKAGKLTSKVPWRFYLLDGPACRSLREILLEQEDKTKLPKMLATAATLIQVTWLPNPSPEGSDALFDPTHENMEHIAASSAAIQNLLIAATARGIPNYWSSGGRLRHREQMELLRIPKGEILLGSVFLFPKHLDGHSVSTGKLRDQRGATDSWSTWIRL